MTQFTERAQDIASSPLDANQKLIANLALSLDEHIANLAEDDPSKVVAALRGLGMTRLANLLDELPLEVRRLRNAQGWDPSSPQWAVIRAAIAWRKGDEVERIGVDEVGLALIEAVDALPDAIDRASTPR